MTEMVSAGATADVVVHDECEVATGDLRTPHVWFCNLDRERSDATARALLSRTERARAERFRHPRDRSRYVAQRAFVRRVLGTVLGRPAETLRFETERCGRPRVTYPREPCGDRYRRLNFSVSHSEDVLGLALIADREIGLDLEVVQPISDTLGVAATLFSPAALAALASRTGPERDLAFYYAWTRKEALTKLQGTGLDCPHAHEPSRIPRWSLRSFVGRWDEKTVVGAVALEST